MNDELERIFKEDVTAIWANISASD